MKRPVFDSSVLFLAAIILLIGGVALAFALGLRSDAVDEALKSDRVVNIAIVLEKDGKPNAVHALFYYPANQRGAALHVPPETGLIIERIKRLARLDAIYKSGAPEDFVDELERLVGTEIPYWIVLDEKGFIELVDILGGLDVFIPNPIDLAVGEERYVFPSGSLRLDGPKAWDYATYIDPDESDADLVSRRQKAFQALLGALGRRSARLAQDPLFGAARERLGTNIDETALRRLIEVLGGFDANLLVTQRVPGVWRNIDGERMLFPHYDGRIVVDIVKQTLNALARAGSFSVEDKVYIIDILNGTETRGLASKTADMFQSFGYEVRTVGNAEGEAIERSVIIDHYGNPEGARTIGGVIRCENIQSVAPSGDEGADTSADFTIVLGKDFNGRYILD